MKTFKVLLIVSTDDDTTEDEVREEIFTLERSNEFNKIGLLTVEDLKIREFAIEDTEDTEDTRHL